MLSRRIGLRIEFGRLRSAFWIFRRSQIIQIDFRLRRLLIYFFFLSHIFPLLGLQARD